MVNINIVIDKIVESYKEKEKVVSEYILVDVDLRLDVIVNASSTNVDEYDAIYNGVLSKMIEKGYTLVDLEDGDDSESVVFVGDSVKVEKDIIELVVANSKEEKVFIKLNK